MTSIRSRLLSAALAGLLALGSPLAALAAEPELPPADGGEQSDLLAITVPDYTPDSKAGDVSRVQKGGLYTLIILPRGLTSSTTPPALTPELLLASEPLFIGSAVAEADGKVTFTNIRLRTAEAAIYYVTGPGLEDAPLAETTSFSVAIQGKVTGVDGARVPGATVSLVDQATGYAYANTDTTADNGTYYLDGISPGSYYLLVKKEGYLPARNKNATVITDGTTKLVDLDISSFLGDVNNDGARDLSDLTDLLSRYALPLSSVPNGLTPDLNGDGAVDSEDVSLFLNAASQGGDLTRGTGSAPNASLSARDTAPVSNAVRSLTFSLDKGGVNALTFTAAHVSLTFRTDYVQPLNKDGGLVSPGAAGNAASCLTPKTGVTVRDARWSVNGDLATLTFSLACTGKPVSLTDLVTFHYRPAAGKTAEQFFQGVFSISHAAAQVGSGDILSGCALEYPNFSPLALDSITIDSLPAEVTIPSAGHPVALSLSATGHKGEETRPGLTGLTWTLEGQTDGVSVSDSLLIITSDALQGELTLRASLENGSSQPLTSPPVTITLKTADPVAQQVLILREDSPVGDHILTGTAGEDGLAFPYAAQVVDQYGNVMNDLSVIWSLSGAPAGIQVSQSGVLTVDSSLPGGAYSFSLHASLGALRAAANITLTLETQLAELILSGPAAVQIPSGNTPLTLRYALSARDALGNAMPAPTPEAGGFSIVQEGDEPTEIVGLSTDIDVNGNLTVTVSSDAQSGDYTLRATVDDLHGDLVLTLLPAQEEAAPPVRVALSYRDELVSSLDFTFTSDPNSYEDWTHIPFRLLLLDESGNQLSDLKQSWKLTTSDFNSLNASIAAGQPYTGLLTFVYSDPGRQFYTLTVLEEISGLSVTIPVTGVFLPKLAQLTLSAPDSLSIPTSSPLEYPLGVTALDADGAPISLPEGLRWSVADADDKAPVGVTLQNGVLTVSPSAKPGSLTLSVWLPNDDGSKGCLATKVLTLEPTDTEKVLVLRRDGQLLSGGVDAIYGKEGSTLSLSYTPVLLDRETGEVTELTEGVSWLGASGAFSLNDKTEPGVYTTSVTAVYQGQSVSLTAQITVYPSISDLFILFDEGDNDPVADRYSFPVPSLAPQTYHGTMMTKITRGGKAVSLPLLDLGLAEYDIDVYTPLTGVYLAYDRSTGRVALTIEPTANTNSMKDPGENDATIRYIGIDFSYYPDDPPLEKTKFFFLTKENPVVSSAVLRQGSGLGSNFVFETARGETTLNTAPGVLSDCFALELLDQYGNSVTDHTVTWKLEGSPKNGSTNLVSLVDPGSAITGSYPLYRSIRRLRISPDTPQGEYHMTLSATAGSFTRSISITMNVSGQQTLDTVTLTGPDTAIIPKWFVKYNASTLNTETRSLAYVAVAQDPNGHEIDASLCEFSWSVTDALGKAVEGVTIKPNTDNAASATVTIDRRAKPTAKNAPLNVSVSATPKGGSEAQVSTAPLTLNRGSLVPTLMTIQGPSSIQMDLPASDATNPTYKNVTETYTFDLRNQYNDPVSQRDAESVNWKLDTTSTYVKMDKVTDTRGYPAAKLTITNPKRDLRIRATLTAQITFPEASTASGQAVVYQNLPIVITVGNPPPDSSGGGGGGGGAAEVTESTVTPATSKSGTTGTSTLTTADVETLSQTTATGTLTIAPKNTSGLTAITVTFPGSLVKDLRAKKQNNSLRIQTAIGTVTMSKSTLASFSNSGNVSITIRNQNDTLAVTFTSNGRTLTTLTGGSATFSAPVKGTKVTAVKGGISQDVLTKSVISNGTLTVTLTGSAEITVGNQDVTASTVTPATSKSGTTGTSTLTTADVETLSKTTAAGTLTIAPKDTSGLTSITVTFPGSLVKDLRAKTQNNSLRIQTAIGTVTIPKGTLASFSNSGNVAITIRNQNDTLAVTFTSNGRELTTLTGGSVTFSASVKGTQVTAVKGGISQDVLTKSVISNGTLTVTLTGSAELTVGTKPQTTSKVFSDTHDHWAKDAISFVTERGLFQGTSETTFTPNGDMTRGMVVTVLHRLENTPATSAANVFQDVPNGIWFTEAVTWANAHGIVQGTGTGFLPNDPVTREQLAAILYRYMKDQGHDITKRSSLTSFSDGSRVSPWAKDAMEWAVATGLINGKTGGLLDPGGKATRAEVATILERLIVNLLPTA